SSTISGNSAVAGIAPAISATGAKMRLKRGLSLAASAHGRVHASEIAYAMIKRTSEASVATGICFASDGHGLISARTSANKPAPTAQAEKTASEAMMKTRSRWVVRFVIGLEATGAREIASSRRPPARHGGVRIVLSTRSTLGPIPPRTSSIPSEWAGPDDAE